MPKLYCVQYQAYKLIWTAETDSKSEAISLAKIMGDKYGNAWVFHNQSNPEPLVYDYEGVKVQS